MRWELSSRSDEPHFLDSEAVRIGLFRGDYSAEDWVRPEGKGAEAWQQLGTVDEFAVDVAGMQRRRRVRPAEEDDSLDMTPMIDCTF